MTLRTFALRTAAVAAFFVVLAGAVGLGQVVPGVGGTNATYQAVYPDSLSCGVVQPCSSPSPITTATATVTKVVAGVANQHIYTWFLGGQASGTNSALVYIYEAGTQTTNPCDTGTIYLAQGYNETSLAPVLGEYTWAYGGGVYGAIASYNLIPANFPLVIPSGYSVCIKTSGTTVNLLPMVLYTLHS